jgi:hypothetical protein
VKCGHASKGTIEAVDKDDLKTLVKAAETVFESVGWRKVPGGWKCNNCTGIMGRTAKW